MLSDGIAHEIAIPDPDDTSQLRRMTKAVSTDRYASSMHDAVQLVKFLAGELGTVVHGHSCILKMPAYRLVQAPAVHYRTPPRWGSDHQRRLLHRVDLVLLALDQLRLIHADVGRHGLRSKLLTNVIQFHCIRLCMLFSRIGTLSGLLLGLGVAFNIDVIVPALERLLNASFLPRDIYLISRMPSEPQYADIMPIAVISLVLAFLATLYPSWRASRVNPAEALRYE